MLYSGLAFVDFDYFDPNSPMTEAPTVTKISYFNSSCMICLFNVHVADVYDDA